MEFKRAAPGRHQPGRHLPAIDRSGIESGWRFRRVQVKNIIVICRKELKSYFASPIAYLLMAIFAVIFGFFFYSYTAMFVVRGMESQMMGRGMPMDVNEWVIRPVLQNASVIGLFLIPMITMRLFAE